jgi:hypothetical protein
MKKPDGKVYLSVVGFISGESAIPGPEFFTFNSSRQVRLSRKIINFREWVLVVIKVAWWMEIRCLFLLGQVPKRPKYLTPLVFVTG